METIENYLAKELEDRQKRNPSYSLRAFAKALSVSPAQLTQVISRKRRVTPKFLKKVSPKLGLSPNELRNFLQTSEGVSSENTARVLLKEDEFKFVADWYSFAILALQRIPPAVNSSDWIAKKLNLSKMVAKDALDRLSRLGIIGSSTKLTQLLPPLDVISETPSPAIQRYHRQVLSMAQEKLEVPVNERDFSALTIAIAAKDIPRYKKMIEDFQSEVGQVSDATKSPDQVYILSCQFFPVSKKGRE